MTLQNCVVLFAIASAVTVLVTEAIKQAMNDSVANNIIALASSVVIGAMVCAGAYYYFELELTAFNIICAVAFVLVNWLGAMVGYDKIKQTFEQIKNKRKGGAE